MKSFLRLEEYKVLFYRIFLAYLFYFIARVLFFFFNKNIIEVDSISQFFKIAYHGLAFDTTAILYANGLFILLSVLPFFINANSRYQKFLFYVYFLCNLPVYALNFVDFIYYKYSFSRITLSAWDLLKNEESKSGMFFRFLATYWYVFLLFFLVVILWMFLYAKIKLKHNLRIEKKWVYGIQSLGGLLVIATLCIGGIRGDFKKSTRPINLVDANRHVTKIQQADLVLNSSFSFLRTLGVKTFKKQNFGISEELILRTFKPNKKYTVYPATKPNIVLIITESLGREYCGAFNKDKKIENYISYTPFLDSLSQHSMIYTNAYANGYKSIHGMSSIISGIPSFKDAFTSSPYAKQKIESLVSCLNSEGYDTSFFHGAPNGSMGFLGYSNILGFDHYYGMTEYGNDEDFDGSWGIWDEPFLQYMNDVLSEKKEPFFSTVFTVTSHEPYVVPEKYKGAFPQGDIPMHQCVGYTDYAFKKFFEVASKQSWFENTIFVITADHCNLVSYMDEFYHKMMNRLAVPILIYKPNSDLKGVNNDIAQHIDIYPTILDMIGYKKRFRSWGRSLMSNEDQVIPFVINYNTGLYYYMKEGYICVFDGQNIVGVYEDQDQKLNHNLWGQKNEKIERLVNECKGFIQNYFDVIIEKKLSQAE